MVLSDNKILLGYKKRGFGAGYFNGFGGKVELGETIEEAARRELQEEVGIVAKNIEQAGVLDFTFALDPKQLEVHVFRVTNFSGTPIETDEMSPTWFTEKTIPYTQMWPDDIYWLPILLSEKYFRGAFHLDQPATIDHVPNIVEQSLSIFDSLDGVRK